MQITRRIAVPIMAFLVFFVAVPVVAQEFGGNIDSRSEQDGEVRSFRNSFTFFARRNPVQGNDARIRWLIEGSVTGFTSEKDDVEDDEDREYETEWVPDLNVARVRGSFIGLAGEGSVLRYRAGRISFSDPARLVYADRIDGLRLDLDLPTTTLTLAGGYTGFLAGRRSAVLVSVDDAIDREDRFTYWGSQRAVTSLGASFPEFFAGQNASMGGVAQFDVRGDYEEQRVHSQYAYANVDGRLVGDFYYELGGAAGFAQVSEVDSDGDLRDPDIEVGFSSVLRTRLFLGANEGGRIESEARYVQDTFVPVATSEPGVLGQAPRSDVAHFLLRYGFRPFAGSPGARARSLELGAFGAVDYPADFDTDGDRSRGLETGVQITTRFFSDFGASLSTGFYAPGADDEDNRFVGRLDLSTSF